VLPTTSPADLSITKAAPVNNRRKQKQSKADSKTKNVGRKRKQGTATEYTGQQKHPPELTQLTEEIEEGTANNANMNTRNLPHLCSTQQRNKTSASNVNEHLMFEEVNTDDEESGDMGNSNNEGAEANIHNKGINLRKVLESSNKPIGDNADNIDNVKGEEFAPTKGHGAVQLLSAPDGWVPPGPPPPPTWAGYQRKGNAPQPGNIDNPGSWSLYSFAPKYKTGKFYSGHFTPAGVMFLPANQHGQRELNGCHFHYQGWTPDEIDQKTFVRDGASQQDLNPLNWRGSLDMDVLKKHGCTADWVRDDPFFFYQLLFPLSPPESSGIEDDSQMPYFPML
jgi:hypothetical protein